MNGCRDRERQQLSECIAVTDRLSSSGSYQDFNKTQIKRKAMAVEVVALARASSSAVELCISAGMSRDVGAFCQCMMLKSSHEELNGEVQLSYRLSI